MTGLGDIYICIAFLRNDGLPQQMSASTTHLMNLLLFGKTGMFEYLFHFLRRLGDSNLKYLVGDLRCLTLRYLLCSQLSLPHQTNQMKRNVFEVEAEAHGHQRF